jgi:glycolate oxidase FAD binding subunit
VDLLCAAMGCSGEISGAAHVPAETARTLPISHLSGSGTSCTLLRLEGFGPSVLYRAGRVAELFADAGEIIQIEHEDCARLWASLRDVEPFAATGRAVWKVSVAPAAGPIFIEALRGKAAFRHFYDWSGGLVWIEIVEALPDALAGAIRTAITDVGGGHATLVRAEDTPADVPRFQPQPEAHAALSRRLKESFDPMNVLNPGRMVRA